MKDNMMPHYKHDCTHCRLLATIDVPEHLNDVDKILDLYYCEQGSFGGTVIARFGSYGSEYMSGLSFPKASANEKTNKGLAKNSKEALEMVVGETNHLTTYALSLAALKAIECEFLDNNLNESSK